MLISTVVLAAALTAAPSSAFARRDRPYDVAHYRIDVRLKSDGAFTNTAQLRLTPTRSTSAIELDAYGLNVSAVRASSGQAVTFTVADDAASRTGLLTVRSPQPFAAGKELTLEIDYSGKASTTHEGLFRVEPEKKDGSPSFFTHFQPTAARRFFPANDQPHDKATSELFVVTDRRYTVLSNGKKLKDEAFAENGENLRRVHWHQESPHSTYLVALAVGEFEPVEVGSSIPATIWVGKGKSDRTFISKGATLDTLSFLQSFTKTKYPWAKFDQVAVPRFFWNGMENTSLVMAREDWLVLDTKGYFLGHSGQVGLIAHEAAHQWFGDLVTPKGWEDTWLNEGFASYFGSLAADAYFDNDAVEIATAERTFVDYMREESGPRSHALVPKSAPSPEEIFDATSYTKGAAVLRMLDTWVGRETFRNALQKYLEKYAHKNATSADFFAVVQEAANEFAKSNKQKPVSVKAFQQSWLTHRGYPILTPETSWDGSTLTVKIAQRPSATGEKKPFVFKLPVVFQRTTSPTYQEKRELVIDQPVTTIRIDLPALPQWVNWNEGGKALAQIWPSSIGEQQWTDAARHDEDPVWRLLSLYALTSELADPHAKEAPAPSDAVVGTLLDAVTKDKSPYVREGLMRRLSETKWRRLPLSQDFARAVLAVAKRPEGMAEDAIGTIRVRRAAIELLGKLEFAEGHKYLISTLEGGQLAGDLNYLSAFTAGVARIGDSVSLATLLSAANGQRSRGYGYFRSAAQTIGLAATPDVVPELGKFLKTVEGNEEIAKGIFAKLEDNGTVKHAPTFPAFVADFVVEKSAFSDDVRSRAVRLLDEAKSPEAKAALTRIREQSPSARLQASAAQVLEQNFPEARPTAVPVKGTKGGGKKAGK